MRNKSLLFLLGAGLVLSLTGCEKEPDVKNEDPQEVHFAVATANPETKTAYSGEGTADPNDTNLLIWERIDWVEGDPLLIWSDYAIDRIGGSNHAHAAHYAVGNQIEPKDESAPYPNQSWSIINDLQDLGLKYDDNHKDNYTFWSIYPADAALDPAPTGGTATTANQVSFEISDEQTGEKDASVTDKTVITPDMDQAVMLAAATAGYNEEVVLKYYPAFTAFEITLASVSATAVELEKVELISTSDLAGTVTAEVNAGVTDNTYNAYTSATETSRKTNKIGASEYSFGDDATKKISFTFPDDANSVSITQQLTFTVFALPQNIEGLTLRFYKANGDFIDAKLKSFGNDITFAACKKNRLYGLALPDGTWHVYLESEVQDWEDAQLSIEYGRADAGGVVVSAAALTHIGGASSWSRTAATMAKTSSLMAYYSVYSPTNGKWRITLKGANANHFTVTSEQSNGSGTDANGYSYIEGNVDGRIIFTLTPTSDAASGDSVELWFTVVLNGKEYILHSEVTRNASKPLTVTLS